VSELSDTQRKLRELGWQRWDYDRARMEGWRLDALWGGRGRVLVARHTHIPGDVSRFGSRKEAEAHVMKKASEGSQLHMHALAIIAKARLLK
jgi:hypothetical protein